MLWLKMQTGNVNIAIDLSGLNLDTIEETDTEFKNRCYDNITRFRTSCWFKSIY